MAIGSTYSFYNDKLNYFTSNFTDQSNKKILQNQSHNQDGISWISHGAFTYNR